MTEYRKVIDERLTAIGAEKPRGIEALIFNQPVSCNVDAGDLIDLATYGGNNFAAAVLAFRDSPGNREWKSLLTAALAYQMVCQFKAPRHTLYSEGDPRTAGPGAARAIAKSSAETFKKVTK